MYLNIAMYHGNGLSARHALASAWPVRDEFDT
jgi:hypothetical protein